MLYASSSWILFALAEEGPGLGLLRDPPHSSMPLECLAGHFSAGEGSAARNTRYCQQGQLVED